MRPARKRELVDDVRTAWRVSILRACRNLCVDTSSYHYKSPRPSQASLKGRIKAIAETRVRFGYRRINVLLWREGWLVNDKRVNRLYREMGLQLRNKSPKRKVKAKLREGRLAPAGSNDVWAMDFVHDQLYDGRKIRSEYAAEFEWRFKHGFDLAAMIPALGRAAVSAKPVTYGHHKLLSMVRNQVAPCTLRQEAAVRRRQSGRSCCFA